MIELVRFEPTHLDLMVEQDAMAYLRPYITMEHRKELAKSRMSYTGFSNKRVVFCAGVMEYWKGRGEAWAILDRNCKKEFWAIHTLVRRFLDICPVRRVEAVVDLNFEAGHRWVRLLGFDLEAPILKGYRPEGGDCSLYARVR